MKNLINFLKSGNTYSKFWQDYFKDEKDKGVLESLEDTEPNEISELKNGDVTIVEKRKLILKRKTELI